VLVKSVKGMPLEIASFLTVWILLLLSAAKTINGNENAEVKTSVFVHIIQEAHI
jgi:hypothetical protein